MMWYSSRKGDDLVLDGLRTALLQQGIEVHAGPQPRNERIALALASGCRAEGDLGRNFTGLPPSVPLTITSPDWSLQRSAAA